MQARGLVLYPGRVAPARPATSHIITAQNIAAASRGRLGGLVLRCSFVPRDRTARVTSLSYGKESQARPCVVPVEPGQQDPASCSGLVLSLRFATGPQAQRKPAAHACLREDVVEMTLDRPLADPQ